MILLFALALAAPGDADALVGKVRVDGPAQSKATSIEIDGKVVKLTGDLAVELERLASAKVEVLGTNGADSFAVTTYRILEIGGGTPLVGELVASGDTLGLRDGDAAPIPLSVPPRSRSRLQTKVGAKVWVVGNKLVTGELKVMRYGILREPPIK